MNKAGADSKVKKTFVRNCEQRIRPTNRQQVVREVDSSSHGLGSGTSLKGTGLNEPTLCSSVALANYMTEVKNLDAPPLTAADLNINSEELCAKVTKKLNFHVNEKIYKNLIELNSNNEDFKTNKSKRPSKSTCQAKKDLEPDIEDFCEDEKEQDFPPKIPILKPKSQQLKSVENGSLHKLVAKFEFL